MFRLRSDLQEVVSTVIATLQRDGVVKVEGGEVVAHNTVGMLPVLRAANTVLFRDLNFRGNLEDYYDPMNRCAPLLRPPPPHPTPRSSTSQCTQLGTPPPAPPSPPCTVVTHSAAMHFCSPHATTTAATAATCIAVTRPADGVRVGQCIARRWRWPVLSTLCLLYTPAHLRGWAVARHVGRGQGPAAAGWECLRLRSGLRAHAARA